MIIDANFLENLSDDLKKIVLDASEAIMQVYKKNTFNTEIKSDGSPVTEADENANKIIIQSLNIISPDIAQNALQQEWGFDSFANGSCRNGIC